MWSTIGHKNQKTFLGNALSAKKYSHAYLFSGPDQIGKKALAIEFANKILGAENQKFNPDLIVIDEEKLKIEQVRNLINDLSLRPYQSAYKIAIIDHFENVTEEASNSILKTLEEPSSTTILILIANNKQCILPTIVSRCQVVNFSRLPNDEILQINKFKKEQLELINGKSGKGFAIKEDKDLAEQMAEEYKAFCQLKSSPQAKRVASIKDYADLESDELQKILANWLDQEHFEMLQSRPQNYKNLQLLLDSIQGLKQNFNKKMVLEKLFLNLS